MKLQKKTEVQKSAQNMKSDKRRIRRLLRLTGKRLNWHDPQRFLFNSRNFKR